VHGDYTRRRPLGRRVRDGPHRRPLRPPNPYGVIDHDVTLESGETFHNPVRVLPHDDGAEVVFTFRRQDWMSDADFDRDSQAVLADLMALKDRVEASAT